MMFAMRRLVTRNRWLAAYYVAALLLLCPSLLQARELVRDTVFVSQLHAEQILLGGPTTILVDQDCRLASISGNHPLEIITIKGAKLTVDDCHDQTYAVDVTGLRLTGDGVLQITGKHNALNLNGGVLCCEHAKMRLEARNSGPDGQEGCALANAGNIMITNSEVWIYGANVGIANAGNITVKESGTRCYISGCHGIATVKSNGGQVGWGADTVTIENAQVYVTALDGSGIVAHAVRIDGGYLDVSQTGGTQHDYAVRGDIQATACSLAVHAEQMAIQADVEGVRFHNCSASITAGENSRAIQAQQMTIIGDDSTTVRISAGREAIFCSSDLTIDNHSVMAQSHARGHMAVSVQGDINITMRNGMHDFVSTVAPMRANGRVNMLLPYRVNNNPIYKVDDSGHWFVNGDGRAIIGRINLTRPSLQDWHVVDSTGLAPFSAGHCTSKGIYHVGEEVTVQLPQSLLNYVNCADEVPSIEWYRSTGDIQSRYEQVGEGFTYLTSTADVQRYVYAKIQFDTHDKCLLTHPVVVIKCQHEHNPEKPELSLDQNRLWVMNPKDNQEYMVLNTFKSVGSLRETDWVSAQSTNDTLAPLRLQGTQGAVNYVYTRFKESGEYDAGKVVLYNAIYYGSGVATKRVNFKITGVNCTVTDDVEGMKNVPLGGVVRIEAEPMPANATDFTGIAGWNWMLTGGTTQVNEAGYGVLYTDSLCIKPVAFDNEHRYTTVYALLDKPTEYNHAVMYVYRKSTETYTTLFNVSNADSTYEPTHVAVGDGSVLTLSAGSSVTLAVECKPQAASLDDVTAIPENSSVEGEDVLPTLTFDPVNRTLTLDATQIVAGITGRYAIKKGSKKVGELNLQVVAPTCDSLAILPNQVIVDPAIGVCQLDVVFSPANAPALVEWTSSDSRKAIVDSTGRVVIDFTRTLVGDSVVISAKSGDCLASCVVHIGGDQYPLWIDGLQINSMNQDDVVRDGTMRLQGHVLTLSDASIRRVISHLDPFVIKLSGTNVVDGILGVTGLENVITGKGQLIVGAGSDRAITSRDEDSVTLLVTGGAVIHATKCREAGITIPHLRVTGQETEVVVGGLVPLQVAELWGNIVSPPGARLLDGFIVDADNNVVRDELVVITGDELVPLPTGDVNRNGHVNVSDVTTLVNMILGVVPINWDSADIDGNGRVNVSDVTALINIILN